ncbi:MAG: hypothetical protein CM15mP23_04960 [Cryomorphaceae bacterium]|nr:MAG: hypothetical protein CM15mP23_04960 [Cryomorphaceae bacterium]
MRNSAFGNAFWPADCADGFLMKILVNFLKKGFQLWDQAFCDSGDVQGCSCSTGVDIKKTCGNPLCDGTAQRKCF